MAHDIFYGLEDKNGFYIFKALLRNNNNNNDNNTNKQQRLYLESKI